ncbi:CoA pyrophosphatase [Clostridium baratii]|uniref:NUDIX hydrolase n=1 Tax=Clostridium baratii TaxID=1561 RepID=UPI0006BAEB22|nr:CoA pyrophosphatase [Clostridium baratii]
MEEFLKKVFKDYKVGLNDENIMKKSAVILPIININGVDSILFEVRTDELSLNPGEVCFPGGRIEKGESPKEAAIRECVEEIGLSFDNLDVITELDTFVSNTNMIIYPFLAYIKGDYKFLINESEVKEILTIPLDYLVSMEPISVYNKLITIPSDDFPFENIINGEDYKFREGSYRVLFYKYKDYVIWGMTARILENFLNKIKNNLEK